MIAHVDLSQGQLMGMIKRREITFGGSMTMKTYGLFRCKAGKRGLRKNRIFFRDEAEALAAGFRPCGCCQWAKYTRWKASRIEGDTARVTNPELKHRADRAKSTEVD